jgi:hypothetical protein
MEEIRLYKCSKCKETLIEKSFDLKIKTDRDKRPVAWYCKKCRQKDYGSQKGHTQCEKCGLLRKTYDKNCQQCWVKSGWRFCSKCNNKKLLLDYSSKKNYCKQCEKTVMVGILERQELWRQKRRERKEAYKKAYPNRCKDCQILSTQPNAINGLCNMCNRKLKIKECNVCHVMQPLYYFNKYSLKCADCR